MDFDNPIFALRLGAGMREVPSYSLKRSGDGRPPGPVWRYAVHFHQSGLQQPCNQYRNNQMSATFSNPSGVHAPLGLYSHTAVVPERTELVYLSGQLGVRPDGSTPDNIAEQADQVFANIVALLRAHGLGPWDIVKLTTFMVAGQDGNAVRMARLKHLGSHRPTSTAVFVSQLVDPAWFVEVEAVAVKSKTPPGG